MASEGKIFETQFKQSADKCGIFFLRLKDSASSWNQGQNTKFTRPNPCDAIMYKTPVLFLLEMKSTKGTSFSFSEKIIKKNQIEHLNKASEYENIISGFVFNFRNTDSTYFVNVKDFINFKNNSGKQSINQKDCETIGIKINQTIKKTNWHYHIDEFVESVGVKC